ncbi:MAG: DUF1684 domain-containing protein [Flavisolibacter sp.]
MTKVFSLILAFLVFINAKAQSNYKDSLKAYINNYVATHEVVKGEDRLRLQFFKVDPAYCIVASFEKKDNGQWFEMQTSGLMKQLYRIYGVVRFSINNTPLQLTIYQSQSLLQSPAYKTYLFLPFTDATSGEETYHGGRYIDLKMEDIQDSHVVIDFNKAYNPYCAYVSGKYTCPIPPAENHLLVAIKAGEKNFKGE